MKNLMAFAATMLVALFIISCKGKDANTAKTGASEPVAKAVSAAKTYNVSPTASTLSWEGYKPGRTHTGTIKVKNGSLSVKDGKIQSGNFVLDMNSIANTDMETGKGKEDLEAHLKGTVKDKATDFFNVNAHPTGKFEITRVTELKNDPAANQMIYGNLTLKGISKNVAFKAKVDMAGGKLTASAPLFKVDRTLWDIQFMSKSFFDNLKDNFIEDEIGLKIDLVAS